MSSIEGSRAGSTGSTAGSRAGGATDATDVVEAALAGAAPRPGRAALLRERWFACSSALGWAAAAEWPDPAVEAVCAVVTARHEGRDARDRAVERVLAHWAGARAGAGIGLAETLTDLAALSTAVSGAGAEEPDDGAGAVVPGHHAPVRGPDGVHLLRAVSIAWTDVACGDIAETAAVDPLSGLASVRYLRTRLAEVYRAARAHGRAAGDEHALVVLTLDVRDWRRVAPLSIAGEAAGVVFDAGESIAVVGRGTVVVLAPREGLAERTAVLRRLLTRRLAAAEGLVGSPTARIVRLPATHDGACALLARLRDAEPEPQHEPEPHHEPEPDHT
ncbi:GGDEF domain-containing protein [Actinomycetospora straminea]|uniref:GGDEF domain-containing protein n=1 Tax=Actinomycetospora straminea TaxID=663607 RepID=UPI0023652EB5|nr:GGDEF domain-containing protein [Actinomycetospora straminea]MDD7935574.1 GGDEF domain-containing protein [Actinomycetospora straminea]